MDLCILLASAELHHTTKFVLILVLLIMALPTMSVLFTIITQNQRKRHAEDLEKQRGKAEIERLEAAVTAAKVEAERIGRNLHDRVSHLATDLSIDLHLLHEHPENFSEELTAKFCDDISHIRQEIRDAAHTHGGYTFATYGLEKAMEKELMRLEKSSRLKATLHIQGYRDGSLSGTYADHAYHVFLEAVWNVQKHASASHVRASLTEDERYVSLEVRDDGIGFEAGTAKGMGMHNIKLRAILAHGTASIDSAKGKGTTITLKLPKHA